MVYQPTFPSPYLETVDVGVYVTPAGMVYTPGEYHGVTVKCQVSNPERIKHCRIDILDSTNNIVCRIHVTDISTTGTCTAYLQADNEWYELNKELSFDANQPSDIYTGVTYKVNLKETRFDYIDEQVSIFVPAIYKDSNGKGQVLLEDGKEYSWSISLILSYGETGTWLDTSYGQSFYDGGWDECAISAIKSSISQENISANLKLGGFILHKHGLSKVTRIDGGSVWVDVTTPNEKSDTIFLFYAATSPNYYFKAAQPPRFEIDYYNTVYGDSSDESFNCRLLYGAAGSKAASETKSPPLSHETQLFLGDKLIESTGVIYSGRTSWSASFSNLLNHTTYRVLGLATTRDGMICTAEKIFTTDYDIYQTTALPDIVVDENHTSVKVDISKNADINGTLEGSQSLTLNTFTNTDETTPETTNAVSLANQNLYWDTLNSRNLDISDSTSIVFHWHPCAGFHGTVFEKTYIDTPLQNTVIYYDGINFYWNIGISEDGSFCPYSGGEAETGAIISADEYANFELEETKYYIINDDDTLSDDDYIVENDVAHNSWWLFTVLLDKIDIKKTVDYVSPVEVSE